MKLGPKLLIGGWLSNPSAEITGPEAVVDLRVCWAKAETARQRAIRERAVARQENAPGPKGWAGAEWQRLLDVGIYATRAELARGEGVSGAAVTMGLRKMKRAEAAGARPAVLRSWEWRLR